MLVLLILVTRIPFSKASVPVDLPDPDEKSELKGVEDDSPGADDVIPTIAKSPAKVVKNVDKKSKPGDKHGTNTELTPRKVQFDAPTPQL